jgi:hypothetical protein
MFTLIELSLSLFEFVLLLEQSPKLPRAKEVTVKHNLKFVSRNLHPIGVGRLQIFLE